MMNKIALKFLDKLILFLVIFGIIVTFQNKMLAINNANIGSNKSATILNSQIINSQQLKDFSRPQIKRSIIAQNYSNNSDFSKLFQNPRNIILIIIGGIILVIFILSQITL